MAIALFILSFLIPFLIIFGIYLYVYYKKPRVHRKIVRAFKKRRFLKNWSLTWQFMITLIIFIFVNWVTVGQNSNNPLRFVNPFSFRQRTVAVGYLGFYYISHLFVVHRQAEAPYFIDSAVSKYKVDRNLIYGIIDVESSFRITAISDKGACGLMQLMPRTAWHVGTFNIFDPKQNVYGGTQYIKGLLVQFNGNLKMAIVAYNWGPSAMKRRGPSYDAEMNNYYRKVISARNRYAGRGR